MKVDECKEEFTLANRGLVKRNWNIVRREFSRMGLKRG